MVHDTLNQVRNGTLLEHDTLNQVRNGTLLEHDTLNQVRNGTWHTQPGQKWYTSTSTDTLSVTSLTSQSEDWCKRTWSFKLIDGYNVKHT